MRNVIEWLVAIVVILGLGSACVLWPFWVAVTFIGAVALVVAVLMVCVVREGVRQLFDPVVRKWNRRVR